MDEAILLHNPRCSKSREAKALLDARGEAVRVVDYLDTPPDAALLERLLERLAVEPRALMRTGEPLYAELGLADPALGDDALIAAMLAHPVLINRPIVVTPQGTRLCRPGDTVAALLPA